MKIKILILAILVFIFSEFFYVTSKLIAFTDSKNRIIERISKLLDADVDIKGKIEVDLFPRPKINISHVRFYNIPLGSYKVNLRSPILTADISIFNILTGNVKFSDLSFRNAKIDIHDSDKEVVFDYSLLPINHVNIDDSSVIFYDFKGDVLKQLSNFKFTLNKEQGYNINGYFLYNYTDYNYNAIIDYDNELIKYNLAIKSDSDSFEINAANYNNSNDYNGNVKLSGNNLQNLLFNLSTENWFLFPDGRNYKYGIEFLFSSREDKFSVLNGKISGDAISGSFIGDVGDDIGGKFIFSFDNFDLDGIVTEKKKSFVNQDFSTKEYYNLFTNFGRGDVYIEGVINNLNFKDKLFGPIDINLSLFDNKIKVNKFDFSLNEGNSNKISGVIDKKDTNFQFTGSLSSKGDDVRIFLNKLLGVKFDTSFSNNRGFDLKSLFTISNDKLILEGLDGKFATGYVTGDIKWIIDDDEFSALNLNFFNLDSRDFQLLNDDNNSKHFFDFYYELLSNRKDNNSLLSRFLWLRSIFNDLDFNFVFSDINYNQVLLNKLSFKGELKYRSLVFNEILLLSEENNIRANSSISIDDDEPKFNLNIDINKANLSFLDYKINDTETNFKTWSKDFILFPNFDNIIFNFKANINSLKYRSLDFKNSNFNFTVIDNLLNIDDISGGFTDNGSFNINGEFLMDGLPQLAISYSFENIQLRNLIQYFFNKDNIAGDLTLSGNLQTYGNTPSIMMKQLKSRNKFYIIDLELQPLDIAGVIQNIANLGDDPYNYFNGSLLDEILKSNTVIGSTKGDLNIEKGVVLLNNYKFSIPGMNSIIAGKIDLPSKSLTINTVMSFVTLYRVQDEIKKMPVTLTNSLTGKFNDIKFVYDTNQLDLLINKLKTLYINALDEYNKYNNIENQ
ncbi:MAG: AsmA family protein [Rickettsiales bacterium]|nr:AsmA family protein [Rickettsiales bacterium]